MTDGTNSSIAARSGARARGHQGHSLEDIATRATAISRVVLCMRAFIVHMPCPPNWSLCDDHLSVMIIIMVVMSLRAVPAMFGAISEIRAWT